MRRARAVFAHAIAGVRERHDAIGHETPVHQVVEDCAHRREMQHVATVMNHEQRHATIATHSRRHVQGDVRLAAKRLAGNAQIDTAAGDRRWIREHPVGGHVPVGFEHRL